MTRTGKRVALTVASTLAALAVAEVCARVFAIGPRLTAVSAGSYRLSSNRVLRYELAPGSADGEAGINSAGMRNRECTLEKPSGTFRIACVGDSICYGLNVARSETFPVRLEALLQARHAGDAWRFEVLNFGVTGYNLPQIAEMVRARVRPYHPDLVLYAYCLNDLQDYSFEQDCLESLLSPARAAFLRRTRMPHSRFVAALRYALDMRLAASRPSARESDHRRDDPTWASLLNGSYASYFTRLYADPPLRALLNRGMADIARACADISADGVVVLFPILMYYERWPIADARAAVHHAAAANNLRVLDLFDLYCAFEKQHATRVGWDALHPNAEGHRLAAEAIVNVLTIPQGGRMRVNP